MSKGPITEPKFGKIFIVRFLMALVIFSCITGMLLYRLDDMLWANVDSQSRRYLQDVVELTQRLSAEPVDSDRYIVHLGMLKESIAQYQSLDHSFIEVATGQQVITMGDTAFFDIYHHDEDDSDNSDGYEEWDAYLIEDISYLDPINEYEDGMLDERKQADMYLKWAQDPIFDDQDQVGKYDRLREHRLLTAYIDWEEHTFIPGMVKVIYKGEEYYIDCTPEDTKNYEKVDLCEAGFGEEGAGLSVYYRATPGLSASDILWYVVPDPNMIIDEIYCEDYADILTSGKLKGIKWQVGYSCPYYPSLPVFKLAPVTSALLIAADILCAVIAALILGVIRYQRDKTVWKIFEYRTKTTEAMAHDLKTPLASIMAYSESMEEASNDPAKVREYSRNISDKVAAMDHMITDILALSRSETGKIDVVKEKVSIAGLVRECLTEFPELRADIKGDTDLTTDKKLMKQVIGNLLSNCDRYGDRDSTVDITIDPSCLCITNKTDRYYEDVGALVKPFAKGENSRGSKGTGLGLAIAENDLSILGYKLELSSKPGEFRAMVKFKT